MASPEPLVVTLFLAGADRARLERMAEVSGRTPEDICIRLVRRLEPDLVVARHATIVPCSGCGLPYTPSRRPKVGYNHYCPECRAAGRDSVERQKRFRKRRVATG